MTGMNLDTYLQQVKSDFPLLSSDRAWFPVIKNANPAPVIPDILTTKITGHGPYIPAGQSWPICQNCSDENKDEDDETWKKYRVITPTTRNKDFVCKINMWDIPEPLQESLDIYEGLFQMFACRYCQETDACLYTPEDLRLISLKYQSALVVIDQNDQDAIDKLSPKLQEYIDSFDTSATSNPQLYPSWKQHNYVDWVESKEMAEPDNANEDDNLMQMTKTLLELGERFGFRRRSGWTKLGGFFRADPPMCEECKKPADKKFFHCDFKQGYLRFGTPHVGFLNPSRYRSFFAEVWFCSSCKKPAAAWHPQNVNPGIPSERSSYHYNYW